MVNKDRRYRHFYLAVQFLEYTEKVFFDIPNDEFERLENRMLNIKSSNSLFGLSAFEKTRVYINPRKVVYSQLLFDSGYYIEDESELAEVLSESVNGSAEEADANEPDELEGEKMYHLSFLLSGMKEEETISIDPPSQFAELAQELDFQEFLELGDTPNTFIGLVDCDGEYIHLNREHILYFAIP